MASFLPDKDQALLAWSSNFSTLISATPAAFNLTAGDATAYAALHTTFATSLAACDPGVRNKAAVNSKNLARNNLKVQARLLANTINGYGPVTDAQKIELGLTVRSAPTPIPPPADAPALDVVSVNGRTVNIRLHDATDASRRGKPPLVKAAAVFSFVGEEAPTDPSLYKFEGNTTRTEFTVVFPNSVAPGTQVFLTAMWMNERMESGPGCEPVGTRVQFGNSMAA